MEIIAFGAVSALILVSSLLVVLSRDMVRAALSLALAFIGVASLFILLEAEFLAAIQIMIYAGAVVVLMLFAVMLTKRRRDGG
jgi:NADH-quinone oxidoreductase subunit J